MKEIFKKSLALGLVGAMGAATILSGCGSSGGSASGDDATSFTMLTLNSVDSVYYLDFDDNPMAQWWLAHEWDADGDGEGTKITIDFNMPPAGGESDYVNTIMATGEYPDVMGTSFGSMSISELYDQGIIIDLTDLVPEYMPNLQKYFDEHPTLYAQITTPVDGEMKLLTLPDAKDTAADAWGSYCYRRDWIAKYGTNPETGEAFTYEWTTDEDGNRIMTDDIVFPSGETDPYYISDWEWMFDIFAKAIEAEGISEGYCVQLTSGGYSGTGDMDGGFGGTMGYVWYIDDDGIVQCGMNNDSARAYVECVTNWYANGWVNKDFEENVGELWFSCDSDHVYTGQVGLWYGLVSQYGNTMESDSAEYTKDIYVAAAPQPINDIYGTDACKNHEPMCFYEQSLIGNGMVITNKTDGKDLASLLTALDFLYSDEVGVSREKGMTDTQIAEAREMGIDLSLYDDNGLGDGSFTTTTDEDGNTVYVMNPQLDNVDDSLRVAISLVRIAAYSKYTGVDYGYTAEKQHNMELANMYDAYAAIGMLPDKLTVDQQSEKSLISTNITTYASQAIPDFITGRTALNDETWQEYVDTVDSYGAQDVAEWLNEVAGN